MPKTKINKWIFWTPRILSILFILFLAIFSLDVFGEGYGFFGTILGLFIHNIPALFLLALLIVSWKYEVVGAITFILAGLLYITILLMKPQLEWYMLSWSIIVAGPAILVGILFFVGWKQKKRIKTKK